MLALGRTLRASAKPHALRSLARPLALQSIARPLAPQSIARPLATSATQHLIPRLRKDLTDDEVASAKSEDMFSFIKREGRWHEVRDKVALRCGFNGFRTLTFGELDGRVTAAAHAMKGMGFKQGDVINIHLHNCEQYVVAFLATAVLGGRASTSNPVYTAAELAEQHLDSGTKFVLSSRDYEKTVAAATAESGVPSVSYVEDAECFANAPAVNPELLPPPPLEESLRIMEDVVALPYSSGTTGKPKGVMLSHFNINANLLQLRGSLDVKPHDVLVGVLPLFHIYGMVVLMGYSLLQQSELVLLPRFEPEMFLQAMSEHKVSAGLLVPPIILFLAKHPMVKQYDLSHLRWIMSGAAPLDAATQETLSAQLGIPIRQGWGMTELSPVGCTSPHETPLVHGTAGTLVASTEGMVVDDEGNSLPVGELGELVIRGPQVMLGYLGRPEATAETIRPDGFLRTGDLAYFDEGGNIYIADRLKELIKVKGYQVAPAELEGRLLEIEQVADAAVIGVPDERAGELPKAFVVKKPDVELSEEAVRAALAEKLAPYKLPDQVVFVDEIPKSASGKILRRMLK